MQTIIDVLVPILLCVTRPVACIKFTKAVYCVRDTFDRKHLNVKSCPSRVPVDMR